MSLIFPANLQKRQNVSRRLFYNKGVVDAKEQQNSGDTMEYNIYMDVFLLLNFIMNLLLLQCSIWILKVPIKKRRMLLSAAFGSLSAGLWLYGIVIGNMGIAVIMTYLAFEKGEKKSFFLKTLCLYLIGFSMEGAIRFTGTWKGCLFVPVVSFFLGRERRDNPKIMDVELRFKGNTKKLKGFYDTGNQLKEPITGKMAHVATYGAVRDMLPKAYQEVIEAYFRTGILENTKVTEQQMYEFTFLSYHSIGKETGQLLGIRMDSAIITNHVGKWTEEKAVIALTREKIHLDGGCQVILNGRLEI